MCVQVISMIQLMLPREAEPVLVLHDTSHISVLSRSSFFLFLYTTNLSDQLIASPKLAFRKSVRCSLVLLKQLPPLALFSSILRIPSHKYFASWCSV